MNDEWLQWTKHNLSRGCSPAEIKKILEDNGFSNAEIEEAMGSSKTSLWQKVKQRFSRASKQAQLINDSSDTLTKQGTQKGLDYAAMACSKIVNSSKARAVKVEDIQLFVIENFLMRSECEAIIREMNKDLRPSTITTGKDYGGFRTSSTCDLGHNSSKIVAKIDNKIAKTLGINLTWSETIQGQKYNVGQEFKAHTDYFEPNTKEFKSFALEMGQRTWTFMVYLNNTEAGGATHFTKIDKTFYPTLGRALVWNNLLEDGSPNPLTIHHGTPVEKGTKLIITKWFRDKGQGQPFID